jgi:multicomponent Na+:H+ antiporter subunit D
LGFTIYLLPKLDKIPRLCVAFVSAGYALQLFVAQSPLTLQLLDNFGVTLIVDQLSGYFILTNALVTTGVILYCWRTDKTAFFYTQAIILHGSVNAALCLCRLYQFIRGIRGERYCRVSLDCLSPNRSIDLGSLALSVCQQRGNAVLSGWRGASLSGKSFLCFCKFAWGTAGGAWPSSFWDYLVKGGIFVSGLWLPLTHSESETPVSALLSGVVVKTGVFPLVRCALMVEGVDPIVRIFGVGTAILGVVYAIFERDTKRTLAFSTVSQLGWILAAPVVAGFYALAHGLAKSTLFLIAGNLPSRNFKELQDKSINTALWITLVMASVSISGFPLLYGFGAKILTMKNLLPWQRHCHERWGCGNSDRVCQIHLSASWRTSRRQ